MSSFKPVAILAAVLACTSAMSAPINQVSYNVLAGSDVVTFNEVEARFDVNDPSTLGTVHNEILVSGGVGFAERFGGQVLNISGNFDVPSATPSGPLTLLAGAPGQNLYALPTRVIDLQHLQFDNAIGGVGIRGGESTAGIGEGSVAILFSSDQSQFGLQLKGMDGGYVYLDFFRDDGTLIQSFSTRAANNAYLGFVRDGGVKDIRGVSIWSSDPNGVFIDNVKHDVASSLSPVPESGSLAMALGGMLALFAVAGQGRRKSGRAQG